MKLTTCAEKCKIMSSDMDSMYNEFINELRSATASACGNQPRFIQARDTAYKLARRGLLKEALTEYGLALDMYAEDQAQGLVTLEIYSTFSPFLLNEMGLLCVQQCYCSDGLAYFRRALSEMEAIYEKHSQCSVASNLYLHTLKNTAMTLKACGQHTESLKLFDTLLCLLNEEKDTVLLTDCLYHVGEVYNCLQDYSNAEIMLKRCIELRKRVFGNAINAVYTCSTAKEICMPLFMLAVVLSTPDVARFDEARECMNSAHTIQQQCRDLELQQATSEECRTYVLNKYDAGQEWISRLSQCIADSERKQEEEMLLEENSPRNIE